MRTDPNLQDPDALYEAIVEVSQDLAPEEGLAFALRLVLILANQIGDRETLAAAVAAARQSGGE